MSARHVNWWAVHETVQAILDQVNGDWPMAGTPAWCSLTHDDPRKWAALLDAAQHWALRVENNQSALEQAGEAISAAEDWSAIAQAKLKRERWEETHPWARPISSRDRGAA
ncbi:DUF2742 domain-containing protein [Mycolicibacterium poriferae]|uniref:DUF2742 domain-containing protein n=1 Tax=Mycolicibacterium poriferae TaxID=39694 RepID=UPI0024BAF126|nr:DUF2742 domain-containing protein [Mycolicibacterium poriferae]